MNIDMNTKNNSWTLDGFWWKHIENRKPKPVNLWYWGVVVTRLHASRSKQGHPKDPNLAIPAAVRTPPAINISSHTTDSKRNLAVLSGGLFSMEIWRMRQIWKCQTRSC